MRIRLLLGLISPILEMRITLTNFGCWMGKTVSFPEGISLITSPSGRGKSTILNGVLFALFGARGKVQTHGQTSCKVEVEFPDFRILRTKGPNRLVVSYLPSETLPDEKGPNWITEEDASAQILIEQRFGKYFPLTSYIKQKDLGTFLALKPAAKLAFLENLLFLDGDTSLEFAREQNKLQISSTYEQKVIVSAGLEMARKALADLLPLAPTPPVFPLSQPKSNEGSPLQPLELIVLEQKRFKNSTIYIKQTTTKIAELNALMAQVSAAETRYQHNLHRVKELNSKLESLPLPTADPARIKELEELLTTARQQRERTTLQKEVTALEEQLAHLTLTETTEQKQKLALLRAWPTTSELQTRTLLTQTREILQKTLRRQTLQENLSKIDLPYQLTDIESDLAQIASEINSQRDLVAALELAKNLLKCPYCQKSCRYAGNHLVHQETVVQGDLPTEQHKLTSLLGEQKELQTLREEIKSKLLRKEQLTTELTALTSAKDPAEISTLRTTIDELEKYLRENHQMDDERRKLEGATQSSTLKTLSTTLAGKQQKLSLIANTIKETELSEEALLQELLHLREEQTQAIHITRQCSAYLAELATIDVTPPSTTVAALQDEIKEKTLFLEEKKADLLLRTNNLKKVDEYNLYLTHAQTRNKWEQQVTTLEHKEKELADRYVAALALKQKILQAETLAIGNLIDTINTHLQLYLDRFFVEHPITIELLNYKKTLKTEKPGISLAIGYKGEPTKLEQLSGGEYDRVQLAFVLAFSEIFNSPLLMLDESIASLDAETTEIVIKALRELNTRKYTLIVAHQVVAGQFDFRLEL